MAMSPMPLMRLVNESISANCEAHAVQEMSTQDPKVDAKKSQENIGKSTPSNAQHQLNIRDMQGSDPALGEGGR